MKKEEEKKGRMDVMDKIEEEEEGVEEKKEEEVKKEEEEEIDEEETKAEEKKEEKEEKEEEKEDKMEEKVEEKVEEKEDKKEEEKKEEEKKEEKAEEKKEEKKTQKDIHDLIMEHLNSPQGKAFLEKVLEEGRLSLERRIKRFEQQAKKEQQILSNARHRHALREEGGVFDRARVLRRREAERVRSLRVLLQELRRALRVERHRGDQGVLAVHPRGGEGAEGGGARARRARREVVLFGFAATSARTLLGAHHASLLR